jgi:solute carrier family 35 protein
MTDRLGLRGSIARTLGMSKEMFIAFSICVFYGGASLSLGLLNKALLSSYKFNCIFFLLSAQMGLQVALCTFTRDFMGNPLKLPKYDFQLHVKSLPLGLLYVANVGVGLLGLSLVNVPMFFCIRRLVSPTILFYEYMFEGKVAEFNVNAAVGTIMAGTLLAGWDTLNSDIVGYSITFINNLCTAASSATQKAFSQSVKFDNPAFATLYYTSLTGLPVSVLLGAVFGEFGELMAFPSLHDPRFWGGFIIALSLGPVLTYSSILCTTYNSPLAMSVTGNVKDVASTVLGAVLFPGFEPTVKNVGGLSLTFVGAAGYAFFNLKKGQQKGGAPAGAPAPPGGGTAPNTNSSPRAEDATRLLVAESNNASGVRVR